MLAALALAAALLAVAGAQGAAPLTAQAAKDEVTSLPGWDKPLPSKQYSGFFEVNKTSSGATRNLHYWFVEASEVTPETAPVILWLNGGPGCSSLDGYLYEHGPLHFGAGLTLVENPWAWTRVANVIYLEAPAGVGFSYATDTSFYNHESDNITAMDNHRALQLFMQRFPQFAKNDLIISGESYAGIYVPTLARLVNLDSTLNLKGIMVGNGVTDDHYGSFVDGLGPFLENHQVATPAMLADLKANCQWNTKPTAACTKAMNAMAARLEGLNIYDLYAPCFHNKPSDSFVRDLSRLASGYRMAVPCIDSTKGTEWLNTKAVKEALHVEGVSPNTWSICSAQINENYTSQWPTVVPIYQTLLEAGKQVLVYSGDTDMAVPITGTRGWIDQLVAAQDYSVQKDWESWFFNDPTFGKQVGGFESVYYGGAFRFTSVLGSGHMAPQFKPQPSYVMLTNFLATIKQQH